ncbi:hypothetical protein HPB51_010103 [Rhipicephalus microplus]|uniref:Uncharacterized protein n=1 Tax=Rhipicephalus microplus TaxID=6941 RepID=A0A9J6F104_RHIMP|nr:hypothetical protein HPB51_010103 [Rhipicephalus microplus]
MAALPSRQLDTESIRQPKFYPLERAVKKTPPTLSPYKPSSVHAMTQTPPSAKRSAKVKEDRPRLVKPPSTKIIVDETKPPSSVKATVDSSIVAVRSRDERDVIQDSSTTSRVIRPSEELEREKSVALLEVRPAPSEATTSQPITEENRAQSTDVFFGKATPVPAQGSKDLMEFKPEQTAQEGALEIKVTRKLSESHTAENTDPEGPKDSTPESQK